MQAKAFAAGVTEIELKVLEATNEDKWGPHGNDMKGMGRSQLTRSSAHLCQQCRAAQHRSLLVSHPAEIARAAEHPEDRALIMVSAPRPCTDDTVGRALVASTATALMFLPAQPHKLLFVLLQNTIWLRLRERDENWRLCYKAMLLCEYLIKQGPMVRT